MVNKADGRGDDMLESLLVRRMRSLYYVLQ